MAKSVFVLGMDITWNSARGDSAQLNVSRPLREINSEKFKRRTIGESGDVNPQWDQPLMIDHEYACFLSALALSFLAVNTNCAWRLTQKTHWQALS